jgi:glucose/arabinose dehydrogenase
MGGMRPRFRLLVLSAVALVIFTACGDGPSLTPRSSETVATAAPMTTLPATPSAAPSAAPSAVDPSAVSVSAEPFFTVPGGPLAMAATVDGSGRLFVASRDGRIWVVRDGKPNLDQPLLDIRPLVSTGGEQGLLGLALHPGFPADRRILVDYTDVAGDSVVASYGIDPADPDRVDPGTATPILKVHQPYANHNGGALAFGPDGYLYISFGDGGSAGDPNGNGQNTDTLLGKILRIDIDHPSGSAAYAVPADNPFVGRSGSRPEIWLYGLRNPWRMSFDRATGDLWIGDVGQNLWEEVDVARAARSGLDFGWNIREASHCFLPAEGCRSDGLSGPVAEYGHGQGCTVIGGSVYRGTAQPLLAGLYLFVDYCTGRLFAIPATTEVMTTPVRVGTVGQGMVSFGEDQAGEIYLVNQGGTIFRLLATAR